jgi:cytoskeletal protein CcmA (bactofilin family)
MARGQSKTEPPRGATIVAANTLIRGDLEIAGDLVVYGRLEGTIRVEGTFTLGAQGAVIGDTDCQAALITGRIKGNLKARDGVDLFQGAKLVGDVYTRSLRIEEGAILQGMSYMGDSYVEDDLEEDTD